MNKKLNTFLFVLGATVFNIAIAILCFMLLFLLYVRFLYPVLPEESSVWSFSFIFVAAIALSIIIYRVTLKFLLKKINLEKYFDPLFIKRNLKKPGV